MTANENGSATVDVVLRCTLADIARATNLRVEDAAFALNEIGLLAMRFSSENAEELHKLLSEQSKSAAAVPVDNANKFVYISRAMVERVAEERNVKPPVLENRFCIE